MDPVNARNLMLDVLDVINGSVPCLSAHLARTTGNVDVSLLVSVGDTTPAGLLLQIVEARPMTTGRASVDAQAMNERLTQTGHIALYGIHFNSENATLEQNSDSTLAQMAELLREHPYLEIFIVGRTDNSASPA